MKTSKRIYQKLIKLNEEDKAKVNNYDGIIDHLKKILKINSNIQESNINLGKGRNREVKNKSKRTDRTEVYGNAQISFKNGGLDEVIFYDSVTKECVFHLEMMDSDSFWIGIGDDKNRLNIHASSESAITFKIRR